MKFEKADFYRLKRTIKHIKSLEDEAEKNRRLADLREKLEKMKAEALKEEKGQSY